MTNRERVRALIRNHPGLTDSEIRQRTGISPHQQVNQICRALAVAGLTRRVTGPHGRIINVPIGSDAVGLQPGPDAPTRSRPVGRATPRPSNPPRSSATPRTVLQPGTTMLVIPCSGSKQPGSGDRGGTSILDVLPPPLAGELADLRRRNVVVARTDESTLRPAAERYAGTLYKSAGVAIQQLASRGASIVIISGGYGLVLAGEPIGMYEQVFRPAMWPNRIIERCLSALAERSETRTVVVVLSASTGYATVFRRTRWPSTTEVLLASPEASTGAMVKAPRAQGEWLTMVAASGRFSEGWRSSDGLRMEVSAL